MTEAWNWDQEVYFCMFESCQSDINWRRCTILTQSTKIDGNLVPVTVDMVTWTLQTRGNEVTSRHLIETLPAMGDFFSWKPSLILDFFSSLICSEQYFSNQAPVRSTLVTKFLFQVEWRWFIYSRETERLTSGHCRKLSCLVRIFLSLKS